MLKLQKGDTVGLVSPSMLMNEADCRPIFEQIRALGLNVKPANHLYANGWGYAASAEERIADINQMIRDPEVKLIFFSGGEGADEVFPFIDYEAAKQNPKIYLSYSDGTSILNPIHACTGQTVLYGQAPWHLIDANAYNREMLEKFLFEGGMHEHKHALPWRTIRAGRACGELTGGYLDNYVYLTSARWVNPEPGKDYVLFLEDYEQFFGIPHISDMFGRLSYAPIMHQVRGLLFGHYSEKPNADLDACLYHFGQKWNIPVAACDDYGHGQYAAILPIGERAELDATNQTLIYPDL